MADCTNFNGRFKNACSYALQKFGLDHFKEKQSFAMNELILGQDAFVILLTGSGKSLIFQAFPQVLDHFKVNQSSLHDISLFKIVTKTRKLIVKLIVTFIIISPLETVSTMVNTT